MSKTKRKIDPGASNQLSLFDIVKQNHMQRIETASNAGSFNIDQRIREMLSEGLRQCDFDRYEAASRMSRLVGREITKSHLDSWSAESKEERNIPAKYLPAFCHVTGYKEPLRLMAEMIQCYLLESEEALMAELGKIECQKRELSQKEKAVRDFLKTMNTT
jgi:hypothetical protein